MWRVRTEARKIQGNAEVDVLADRLKAFAGSQKSSRVSADSPDSEYEEIFCLLYNDIFIVLSSYKKKGQQPT